MLLEKVLMKFGLTACLSLSFIMISSIFGFYHKWVVILILIGMGIYFFSSMVYDLVKRNSNIKFKLGTDAIIVVIIIGFSLFNGLYHHEMPVGRDDMSYLMAAVQLDKHSDLSFNDSLFQPGYGFFNLQEDLVTSQFLPGYITYLSIYYTLGGLDALFWANVLLLFFFLVSLYFIGRRLFNKKTAILIILFSVTSFFYNWFPRRINSENLFMFLFWFSLWILFYAIQKKDKKYFFLSFIPISITLLTRIEGLIYFVLYILIATIVYFFIFKRLNKKILTALLSVGFVGLIIFEYIQYLLLHNISYFKKHIFDLVGTGEIIIAIIGLVVFLIIFWVLYNREFKKDIFSLRLYNIIVVTSLILVIFIVFIVTLQFSLHGELTSWHKIVFDYTLVIISAYLLIVFAILGLVLLIKNLNYKLFILVALCAPSFYALFDPYISVDPPWFLRRFVSVFVPICFMLSAYFIVNNKILSKRSRYTVITGIVVLQLLIASPIIFHVDHKGFNDQIKVISDSLGNNDLLIVKIKRPLSKVGVILHYAYDENAIVESSNFLNSELVLNRLLTSYDNLFILTQNGELPQRYDNGQNIIQEQDFKLNYSELYIKPQIILNEYRRQKSLSLDDIIRYSEQMIPDIILQRKYDLELYRVVNKFNYELF